MASPTTAVPEEGGVAPPPLPPVDAAAGAEQGGVPRVVVMDDAVYTEAEGGALPKTSSAIVGDAGVALSKDASRPWLPPAPASGVPARCYVHGMPLTMGLWYDPTHMNHRPPAEGAPAGAEEPHAVAAGYAGLAMGRALTEHVVAMPAVEADTGVGGDAEAFLGTGEGVAGFNAVCAAAPKGGPKEGGYATPATLGTFRRVHGMVRDAVTRVLDSANSLHTGLVISRPVGAALAPGTSGHGAVGNAVWSGVCAAREAGKRVAVVNLQGRAPQGLVDAAAEDEGVAVVSVHHDAGVEGAGDAESTGLRHGGRVLCVGLTNTGAGYTDIEHVSRTLVVPAVTAFNADVIIVVVGDDTDPAAPLVEVRQNIEPKTVLAMVQRMVGIQSRVVVVTDVMRRLTRGAEVMAAAAHALQGRGRQQETLVGTMRTPVAHAIGVVQTHAQTVLPPGSALGHLLKKHAGNGVDVRERELMERQRVAHAEAAVRQARAASEAGQARAAAAADQATVV